jgi:NADH:ubiquinone oxidoreductase subunit F (NADH-binding)
MAKGVTWYRALGNPATPGTKLYTVLGHINRPGLFEAPYGLTLRQIIEQFGAGMRPGSTCRFVLAGGAAGTLVPATLLDVPLDYASAAQGVMLGAGAFLICDQSVSPVMMLRELMHFFTVESCGKCTPCRMGTLRARQILDRLVAGDPGDASLALPSRASLTRREDVGALHELAAVLEEASFCGLGQSAAWPIKSALQHFDRAFTVDSVNEESPQ